MKKFLTGVLATFCVGVAAVALATDSVTASAAAQLVYLLEPLDNPPACVLTLEEAKVKNMAEWGYRRVDDEYDAWYFRGDGTGTARKNPEIRFVAEGVQTSTEPYTLIPLEVGSFSFDYAIVNSDPQGVDDITSENYIVQILGADELYPVMLFDIEADGDWHTITVDESTPFYGTTGGAATTYGQYKDKFCGFLFKMGGLDGEYLIKDITLYDFDGNEILVKAEEPEVNPPETGEDLDENSDENMGGGNAEDGDEPTPPAGGSTSSVGSKKSSGCGSFGVGSMTLGALAAAGVALSVSKKKTK